MSTETCSCGDDLRTTRRPTILGPVVWCHHCDGPTPCRIDPARCERCITLLRRPVTQ